MFLLLFIIVIVIAYICMRIYVNTSASTYIGQFELLASETLIEGGRARPPSRDRVKNLITHPRSKSEAGIIKILEGIVGDSFPTVNPAWLIWKSKQLELDGYNAKHQLALEFSGPLHTKWFPDKEQYSEYFERIVRDVVKKRLCKKHGVKLIVVDSTLPRIHWYTYLKSRLNDIGFIPDKPFNYISEQVIPPFRNTHIEAELGIECEYSRATIL